MGFEPILSPETKPHDTGGCCRGAVPARFHFVGSAPAGLLFLAVGLLFLCAGCDGSAGNGADGEGRHFPEIRNMSLVRLPQRVDEGDFIRPSACFVDTYEVTRGEYRDFLESSGYRPDDLEGFPFPLPGEESGTGAGTGSGGKGPSAADERGGAASESASATDDELPVVLVNYADAEAFAAFHGKEIPTWSEWLIAAGISYDRPYPWGDQFVSFFCNSRRSKIGGPARVGTFESGKSPWGCYDMAGNVAEWTSTLVGDHQYARGLKVHRVAGGSFNEWGYPRESKITFDILRTWRREESRNRNWSVGFRCIRRDAVPLVARLAERLEGLPPEERDGAVRELAEAGRGMEEILLLLDFKRRSTLMQRTEGIFSIENLGSSGAGRAESFLLKPIEGEMRALAGGKDRIWSAPVNSSCTVAFIRDGKGRVSGIVMLESETGRVVVRDPGTGKSLWSASTTGTPGAAAAAFPARGSCLLTSWVDEESGPVALSRLLCHGLESGRLLWEKELDGALLSFEPRDDTVFIVIEDRPSRRIRFSLLDLASGAVKAHDAVAGLRAFRFVGSPGKAAGLLAVDGASAFSVPETTEQIDWSKAGLISALYTRLTGGSLPALLEDIASRIVVIVRIGGDDTLEAETRFEHSYEEAWKKSGIDRRIVLAPDRDGPVRGEAAEALCDEFLAGRMRFEAILEGVPPGTALAATEIDRKYRLALLSGLPGERCGTMILLQDVLGFSYRILDLDNGTSRKEKRLLLWSSGGSMIRFDAAAGTLHWWREFPGFSARMPLVAELDGDRSREVVVFSKAGEIIVIDLETGRIELRMKKTGAVINDLNVVDTDGDGLSEIVAGFKDEGIYLVNPRVAGRRRGLDIALSGMAGGRSGAGDGAP